MNEGLSDAGSAREAMSHVLRKDELHSERELGTRRVGVHAMVERRVRLRTAGHGSGLSVLHADTRIAPLPDRLKVVGEDGEEIKPTRGSRFWITTETIDPMHVVCELPEEL